MTLDEAKKELKQTNAEIDKMIKKRLSKEFEMGKFKELQQRQGALTLLIRDIKGLEADERFLKSGQLK